MSRVVLNDHPWSDEEIEYALSRGRDHEVEVNKREFPPGSVVPEEDSLSLDNDIYEHVRDMSLGRLKVELKKIGLPVTGPAKDLRVSLAQHLQEERDGNS